MHLRSRQAEFAGHVRELRFTGRGAHVFHDYREMLDSCRADLDLVSIPAPISLHAPMHGACVARDLPVYLEKPPMLDCRAETGGPVNRDLVLMNFQAYASCLRGEVDRPATRLIDCRSFVQLNSLAYIAAKTIATIPPGHVRAVGGGFLTVDGLPEAITEFIRSGRFPGEQSLPWAAPGGSATPDDVPKPDGILAKMCA